MGQGPLGHPLDLSLYYYPCVRRDTETKKMQYTVGKWWIKNTNEANEAKKNTKDMWIYSIKRESTSKKYRVEL
jgi:hypothetical protein